ncbi:MAG: class D beta-lactamase [Anaerolineae bacterium]|nr:class D beta-lactamase [Phycisphaerae bacterium]
MTHLAHLFMTALLLTSNTTERADLQHHFRDANFDGGMIVYDLTRDQFITVNGPNTERPVLPASTFKIFNSLVALETGAVKDEREVFKWDGVKREREALDRDHHMRSAFKNSVVWFYQEIAHRVGQERMQSYIDKVGYGNRKIGPKIDTFWLDGEMRISARQQVDVLTRLYRNELPFSQRSMDIVKRIMISEQTPDYVLRAKTGWALRPTEEVGWWVGWVERSNGDVYVFAMNIVAEKPNRDLFGPARMEIARAILKDLGAHP